MAACPVELIAIGLLKTRIAGDMDSKWTWSDSQALNWQHWAPHEPRDREGPPSVVQPAFVDSTQAGAPWVTASAGETTCGVCGRRVADGAQDFQVMRGVECSGSLDIQRIRDVTEQQCRDRCLINGRCLAYEWGGRSAVKCVLKKSCHDVRTSAFFSVGLRIQGFSDEYGVECNGTTIQIINNSLFMECRIMCAQRGDCKVAQMNTQSSICQLMDQCVERKKAAHTVVSVRAMPSATTTTTIDKSSTPVHETETVNTRQTISYNTIVTAVLYAGLGAMTLVLVVVAYKSWDSLTRMSDEVLEIRTNSQLRRCRQRKLTLPPRSPKLPRHPSQPQPRPQPTPMKQSRKSRRHKKRYNRYGSPIAERSPSRPRSEANAQDELKKVTPAFTPEEPRQEVSNESARGAPDKNIRRDEVTPEDVRQFLSETQS